MMTGKKGLSTVVTTLIIVLLVLAAIGIIWNPIRELLTQSGDSLSQTKCLDIEIRAVKVNATTVGGTTYNVTLKRSASGDGEFGAKLIFYDSTGDSGGVVEAGEYFSALEQKIVTVEGGIAEAVKVEITPYYIDESTGESKLCSTSTEKEFTL